MGTEWIVLAVIVLLLFFWRSRSKKRAEQEAEFERELKTNREAEQNALYQKPATSLSSHNSTVDAPANSQEPNQISSDEMDDRETYRTNVGVMSGKQFKDLERVASKKYGSAEFETAFPSEKGAGLYIKTSTHDVYWEDSPEWDISFTKKVMERTSVLQDLSNKYGMQFILKYDGASVSYDYFWTNFEKQGLFKSECCVDMHFEEGFEGWKLYFDINAMVTVETFSDEDESAHEYELLSLKEDELTNFTQVKSQLKKMFDATSKAMEHPNVSTPFKVTDERGDNFDLFEDDHILKLQFKNGTTDRLAKVGRSVFDWNYQGFPKWICGFSEHERGAKDYKIKSISSIIGEASGKTYYQSDGDQIE